VCPARESLGSGGASPSGPGTGSGGASPSGPGTGTVTFCNSVPPAPAAGGPSTLLLIDDLEDGDDLSFALPQGRGVWNVFNDATPLGSQYPSDCSFPTLLPGEHDNSNYSFLTYGCGLRNWGAGIQLILRKDTPGCHEPYDASGYDGIEFKARGSGVIRLGINTIDTTPPEFDGVCTSGCFQSYEKAFEVHADWAVYRAAFSDLSQVGAQTQPNVSTILTMGWLVGAQTSFDYAIDDVALYAN